jgi:peptidoglycan/xylan/chitin deacetylase (PgdA/CDA1 family)
MITIITYHYVRDLKRSRYPEIKGLDAAAFREQVRYVKAHYNVVSGEQLIAAVGGGEPLPPKAALLTFDDGYIDHYTEVFPALDREGLPGCFFPVARCVEDQIVLDVNKIHFVLASGPNPVAMVEYIEAAIGMNRSRYNLKTFEEYWQAREIDPYDSAEVTFVKRMLQRELPAELRSELINELFSHHVTKDEAAFARELYMSADQLQTMRKHGMYIGSHGYEHVWLNSVPPQKQAFEVDRSLAFLKSIGANTETWMMCYPYGAHDASLREIIRKRGCAVGLTTELGIAGPGDPLTLPRLDTNDLPKDRAAAPCKWTLAA